MGRTYNMTWMPTGARWRKIHDGKVYYVTCRELDCHHSKEASYQEANRWWSDKLRELRGQPTELERMRGWAERHDPAMVPGLQENIDAGFPSPAFMSAESRAIWHDRLSREQRVPEDRLVRIHIDRYLALERSRAEAGDLSRSEYDGLRLTLTYFSSWLGETATIDILTPDRWESYWSHLLTTSVSIEYKKKRLRHARHFLRWLTGKGVVPPVANLESRKLRFRSGEKTVEIVSDEDLHRMFAAATDRLRLVMLLMLNTGSYQKDISDLRPDEVDWEAGRITRRRSKSRRIESAPVVTWTLWDETFRMLLEQGRREGDRVFVSESGTPLLWDKLRPDGRRIKIDAIKSACWRMEQRSGVKIPLKHLRKTSATRLARSRIYAGYVGHFLGHAPRTMATAHYVQPSQPEFDEAVRWLGDQFGFGSHRT